MLPDNTPYAAAVHYSFNRDQLELYFFTKATSKKVSGLLKGNASHGFVVIGFDEEEKATVQMPGMVKVVSETEEINSIKTIHYARYPDAQKNSGDPDAIFLQFVPNRDDIQFTKLLY
jgi:general stress protein 26